MHAPLCYLHASYYELLNSRVQQTCMRERKEKAHGCLEAIKKERNELVTMMLKEKSSGKKTQGPKQSVKRDFTCESL